jgi:hypothetical protein
MEMEKMFECLLAKMEANKAEMKADRKAAHEDLMAKLDAKQKRVPTESRCKNS